MISDGHGSFAQPVSYRIPVPYGIQTMVAADINGDGNLDLVAAIPDATSGDAIGRISVWLSKGDGSAFKVH